MAEQTGATGQCNVAGLSLSPPDPGLEAIAQPACLLSYEASRASVRGASQGNSCLAETQLTLKGQEAEVGSGGRSSAGEGGAGSQAKDRWHPLFPTTGGMTPWGCCKRSGSGSTTSRGYRVGFMNCSWTRRPLRLRQATALTGGGRAFASSRPAADDRLAGGWLVYNAGVPDLAEQLPGRWQQGARSRRCGVERFFNRPGQLYCTPEAALIVSLEPFRGRGACCRGSIGSMPRSVGCRVASGNRRLVILVHHRRRGGRDRPMANNAQLGPRKPFRASARVIPRPIAMSSINIFELSKVVFRQGGSPARISMSCQSFLSRIFCAAAP